MLLLPARFPGSLAGIIRMKLELGVSLGRSGVRTTYFNKQSRVIERGKGRPGGEQCK
jgi:hypothetical protein